MHDDFPGSLPKHKTRVTGIGKCADPGMNKALELANLVGPRLSRKEEFDYFRLPTEVLHELVKFPRRPVAVPGSVGHKQERPQNSLRVVGGGQDPVEMSIITGVMGDLHDMQG